MIEGLNSDQAVDALLINSPLKNYDQQRRLNNTTLPVLGLGYIATYLDSRGFNVGVIDAEARGLGLEEIVRLVSTARPRWVGMNLLAPTYQLSTEILAALGTDYKVMLGGHLARPLAQRILGNAKIPRIDALVLGEGELRSAALLSEVRHRETLPGILWREECGNTIRVSDGSDSTAMWLAPDIDMLPLLDRKFLAVDPFIAGDGQMESNMIGSRGCPYNCSFCSAAVSVNPDITIRTRSPEGILTEMAALHADYDVTAYRFVDDLFLANPPFMRECLASFERAGIADWAVWDATGRINVLASIRPDLLDLVAHTGCREVSLGMESGSDRLLKYMGKKITRDLIITAIRRLTSVGISVKGYFILGFPTETVADLQATVSLAHKLWEITEHEPGNLRISAFEFRPYPGTIEWERLLSSGRYTEDQLLAYEHIDLTDSGSEEHLYDRDEFSYSVNQQFGDIPLEEVRRVLNELMIEQHLRLEEQR